MAEKRMFAKSIVLSDAFLDMPMSARCLYFTLSMFADDDGFVGSPKAIMRQCGASQDDLVILLQKRYVLGFDSGVIVIKHWRINNFLRKDRYIETTYIEELSQLSTDAKGAYIEAPSQALVDQRLTNGQPSIDKNSEVKVSTDKKNKADAFSDFAGENDDLLAALRDFEKMRKSIGKPLTDRAKTMLLNKLQSFPRNEWIAILEQSIFHSWQGIFPLHNGKVVGKQKSAVIPEDPAEKAENNKKTMDQVRRLRERIKGSSKEEENPFE